MSFLRRKKWAFLVRSALILHVLVVPSVVKVNELNFDTFCIGLIHTFSAARAPLLRLSTTESISYPPNCTMSDPLSVTASIITVAALAYTSSKALYDLIASIRDAPKVFHDLNNYIEALSRVLATLRTDLDSRHRILSPNQVACLREASTIMEGCDLACRDFRTKIEGLTTHSQSDRRSFRAGFKLSFQNKAITDFRMRVVSWRESLSLALDAVLM